MRPTGTRHQEPTATAPAQAPVAGPDTRGRSAHQTLAVCLLALGIASICFGLYSLIQAFDVFDLPITFKVWFWRAVTALMIGLIALHFGARRVEML